MFLFLKKLASFWDNNDTLVVVMKEEIYIFDNQVYIISNTCEV